MDRLLIEFVDSASAQLSKIQFNFSISRDLTLHQNRWHCDCHLLALHNWLQNFTVPNSVEPRCHSPPRLINEPIKSLAPTEFACIPKVSPTSMYLEVIEGKNMSLVCTIEVIILYHSLDPAILRSIVPILLMHLFCKWFHYIWCTFLRPIMWNVLWVVSCSCVRSFELP